MVAKKAITPKDPKATADKVDNDVKDVKEAAERKTAGRMSRKKVARKTGYYRI